MSRIIEKSRSFFRDEEGLGTLEMLLILAILVVIAIAFRKWIINWVSELFSRTNTGIDDVTFIDQDSIDTSVPSGQ